MTRLGLMFAQRRPMTAAFALRLAGDAMHRLPVPESAADACAIRAKVYVRHGNPSMAGLYARAAARLAQGKAVLA